MQHSVITAAGRYGLGLDEKLISQYLGELGYDTHCVGKVPIANPYVTCLTCNEKN